MSNTFPECIPLEDYNPQDDSQPSKIETVGNHNKTQQGSQVLQTSSASQELQVKKKLQPFVGIRQYTSQLSPKLANPGFIKRSRLIYNKLCPDLIKYYPGWYIAIEADSGNYFLNPNKAVAQQLARQKHPEQLICTFQLIATGVV